MDATKQLVEKMSTEEGVLSMMDSMAHYPPTAGLVADGVWGKNTERAMVSKLTEGAR